MNRRLMIAALGIAAVMSGSAEAQTTAEMDKAKAEIWAKEKNIYEGRAKGGLAFYVESAAPNYVGWAPQNPKPLNLAGLKDDGKKLAGLTKEKLEMSLTDFTLQGDTAVIYYINHRSVLPDGTPTDQTFENIHVWTRMNNDWRIVGAMSRAQPKR